jgi:uncharacterized protein YbjT (DUF2867 family)
MVSHKVIVFGATGAVGTAVARTTQECGSKVILAMRDTNKSIRGLNETEAERVYADLTKPETVYNAVKKFACNRAFLYVGQGSPDHMKSVIEALRSAGIEFVVFLSSYTVQSDPKTIPPSEATAYMHAQVEANLQDIFESNFVALRPGPFASNTLQYKSGIEKGEVRIFMPDANVGYIDPEDIGRVAGTILAEGPLDEQKAVYLYGPQVFSQAKAVQILAKGLGKNPVIRSADEQEAYRMYVDGFGSDEGAARDMINSTKRTSAEQLQILGFPVREEDLLNVEKYSGRRATTLEEWIEKNKMLFVS